MSKDCYRQIVRCMRDQLGSEDHQLKSKAICKHLEAHPSFKKAESVFLTLPFGSEFDTWPLIRAAWKTNKKVLVPICLAERQLGLAQLTAETATYETPMGLTEIPREEQVFFDPQKLDFCLLPGLVFDPYGGRIGYGGGYYDRFLPQLPKQTAVLSAAFDLQVLSLMLPLDPHDIPVPELWTESGQVFGPQLIKTKTPS